MRAIRVMMTRSVCALPLCAISIVRAQGSLPNPVTRDSAGIRIVEYPTLGPTTPPMFGQPNPLAAKLPQAFKRETKPYLDLGGVKDNENEEFDASRRGTLSATELSDGTIVVNDGVHLKFFSAKGKFIRSVGREGSGPGEFRQTDKSCRLRGDTVMALEYGTDRPSLWTSEGKHIRTAARLGPVAQGGCLPDGTLVVSTIVERDSIKHTGARSVHFRQVRLDGSVVRELATFPAPLAGGSRGAPSVIVDDNEMIIAPNVNYELRIQTLNGKTTRIVRLLLPPARITDDQWREYVRFTISPNNSQSVKDEAFARMMAHKPGFFGSYFFISVDPVHRIWVSDPESSRGWNVFDRTGLLLGRVDLPFSTIDFMPAIVVFGTDHIAVRERDADGAPHLRFYHITAAH